MIVAKWAKGFEGFYKNANAQLVANEIISIGQSATPTQIVEKAKDKNSELHKCFTWEDSIAADKWRLQEARNIVHCLVIDTNANDEIKTEGIRVFHKVDNAHESGYKSIEVILQNADEYEALLKQAKADLISFKKKYAKLAELEDVFSAIDQLTIEI